MTTVANAFVHGFSKAIAESPKRFFAPAVAIVRTVYRSLASLYHSSRVR